MESVELRIRTDSTLVTDLTDQVARFGRAPGGDGLVNVFVPHATAGIAIFETGAGSEEDLAEALERWLPRDGRWVHHHGSPGHGADHLLPAIVSPSVTIPVVDGRLALGTWQRICLVDPNVDNPDRRVRLSFLPG